ncbi:MAG TPA: hypothetical protein VK709_19020 [Candidatus Saccharimonadales bacterium]|nr:hypothetical protein [Candidatus Saccharimonadales bacterium]
MPPSPTVDTSRDAEAINAAQLLLATCPDIQKVRDTICAQFAGLGYLKACRIVMEAASRKHDYTAEAVEFVKQNPDMPETTLTNATRFNFPTIGRKKVKEIIHDIRKADTEKK